MADHTDPRAPQPGNHSFEDHVATYDGVINMLFYGAIVAFAIAALVIWLIYH